MEGEVEHKKTEDEKKQKIAISTKTPGKKKKKKKSKRGFGIEQAKWNYPTVSGGPTSENVFARVAKALASSSYLLLTSGAGMGADAGLSTFATMVPLLLPGGESVSYTELCQPKWLKQDPEVFYGFFGSNFNLYRGTPPHEGYEIVRRWSQELFPHPEKGTKGSTGGKAGTPTKCFVVTSNVDGHWRRAGFTHVRELHGSYNQWQCSTPCKQVTWKVPSDFVFEVDKECVQARDRAGMGRKLISKYIKWEYQKHNGFISNHPRCPHCGALARPSILMFGDGQFVIRREEDARWQAWRNAMLEDLKQHQHKRLMVLEIGAGIRITRVRNLGETLLQTLGPGQCDLVRINLDGPAQGAICSPTFALKSPGLHALQCIDHHLRRQLHPADHNSVAPSLSVSNTVPETLSHSESTTVSVTPSLSASSTDSVTDSPGLRNPSLTTPPQ